MAMQREPEQETKGGTGSAGLTITVRIPMPLRKLTGEESVVAGEGSTLGECIEGLEARYPGMKERLCDDTGDLRRFVNVYVNGEDVRFLDGLSTPLSGGAEVSIVPAVAGGS